MATPKRSPELLRETYDAWIANDRNAGAAARSLGRAESTFKAALDECKERGYHLSDGARNSMELSGLRGLEVRGGHRRVYDDDGRQIDTVRYNVPEIDAENALDRIRAAFDSITPAAPIVRSKQNKREDVLAFLPHADWHLGMVANEDQVGREYNRKIAVDRILTGMERCIASQPACEIAVVMNAGDLLHANDDSDLTVKSKNKLKVQGTHHQNFETAVETSVAMIDMALSWHGAVEYRGIPGNHDPNIPGPLSVALRAYYRQEPRVKIVVSENKFFQRNFGVNFLAAHHGDGRAPKDIAAALPGMFPGEWGEARHWHFFTAHKHHAKSDTFGHTRWFQLPSVCSVDPHAFDLGYGGAPGLRALTFHKANGLEDEITVNL